MHIFFLGFPYYLGGGDEERREEEEGRREREKEPQGHCLLGVGAVSVGVNGGQPSTVCTHTPQRKQA